MAPTLPRYTWTQHRPELANPRGLLDLRVRRALAHSTDKDALNDGLYGGEGVMSDTLIRPSVPFYQDVLRAITRYPFDLRRGEQLMAEAGYNRGGDGILVNASGERLTPQLITASGASNSRQAAIQMDGWRRAGVEVTLEMWPPARNRDLELRAAFPGLQSTAGSGGYERSYGFLSSAEIGGPPRWVGGNRGGWSNPEYDRLWTAYTVTLDPTERTRTFVQMEQLLSDQLPLIPLCFGFEVAAHLASLVGPDPNSADTNIITWNIHEWDLR
jgi:peptide/nickel transport system substrate-binding protein